MGWIARLFGLDRTDDEAAAVMQKLSDFLNMDLFQNEAQPDDLKAMLFEGGSCDVVPGAEGEFGFTPRNPIPVNGAIGEVTYLSSLRLNDGRAIFAHRLGAQDKLDIYEAVSDDGQEWFVLYLNPYHTRKSSLLPHGFRFEREPRVRGIFATNQRVKNFPSELPLAIREWSMATLGMPLVGSNLRHAVETQTFRPPIQHSVLIDTLVSGVSKQEISDIRQIYLYGFSQNKMLRPLLAVLKNTVGYADIDTAEAALFCASVTTYCYLRFGPKPPDQEMLDRLHQGIVADIVTGRLAEGDAVALYQQRYQEYIALINPIFDSDEKQKHHMTTLLMHVCERTSHASAQGHMIKITLASPVIAALLDDSIQFSKKLARRNAI